MNIKFNSLHEIIVEARRNVTQFTWNYISGGSESETTLRRNRQGLDSLAFRPRVLRNVNEIDPSTSFLGHLLRIPVLMAPMGNVHSFAPEGAATVSRASHEFGTANFVSSVSEPSLEETAAAAPNPKFYQLYVWGDMKWVEERLNRVRKAGYDALTLTVDTTYYGAHERQLIQGWIPEALKQKGKEYQASLTWETMDAIRELWNLPFILKGIVSAEDAVTAVEHGASAVYISNHGGRQLDHGQGSIDALREIVVAVNGQAEIIIDGGFVRGTDVLKAIALGANAVAIGKLQGWALAAAGEQGLFRALEILEEEIKRDMGLLGITRLDEINPDYVTEAKTVCQPHAFSAFPHLPREIFH